MSKHENQQPFSGNGKEMGVTYSMSSGTAKLQRDAGGTWVDVPSSDYSASTDFTIYAPTLSKFRFVLTGDAEAYTH